MLNGRPLETMESTLDAPVIDCDEGNSVRESNCIQALAENMPSA